MKLEIVYMGLIIWFDNMFIIAHVFFFKKKLELFEATIYLFDPIGWLRKFLNFMMFFFCWKARFYAVGHACKVYMQTKLAHEEIILLSLDQTKLN